MKKNEAHHQKKVVLFLTDLKLQNKIVDFFAVENENPFSKFINKSITYKLEQESKKMGKKKGVSDLVVIGFGAVHFIEMKDAARQLKTKLSFSHTKVSREQQVFLDNVKRCSGSRSVICYGYDEAKEYIVKNIIGENNGK